MNSRKYLPKACSVAVTVVFDLGYGGCQPFLSRVHGRRISAPLVVMMSRVAGLPRARQVIKIARDDL
jgi:hypothetical protein